MADEERNLTFGNKLNIPLFPRVLSMNVTLYRSNTDKRDDMIGSQRVTLRKAITGGYDESTWPLQKERSGSYETAGEVTLIMRYEVPATVNAGSSTHTSPHCPPEHPRPGPQTPYGQTCNSYPLAPPHDPRNKDKVRYLVALFGCSLLWLFNCGACGSPSCYMCSFLSSFVQLLSAALSSQRPV